MNTSNLTKVYGDRVVVDSVDFSVRGGEIFGLFGPNGSGKSTILRMLTGITQPNKGSVQIRVNGNAIDVLSDPIIVREHASILTEIPALYENMELYHYLKFYGRMGRLPEDKLSTRVLEAVTIVGMEDHIYRPLRQMSMGERQRVEIARVLLKDSPIMFLDEPFNGIDITTRREIREYLKKKWLNESRCVFFTSHNLLESEHFVDRFAFIYQGKIIASGDEEELKTQFSTKKFVIILKGYMSGEIQPDFDEEFDDPSLEGKQQISVAQNALLLLIKEDLILEGEVVGNKIFLTVSSHDDLDVVIKTLVKNGITFHEVHPVGSIEDIFITLLEEKKKKEGFEDSEIPVANVISPGYAVQREKPGPSGQESSGEEAGSETGRSGGIGEDRLDDHASLTGENGKSRDSDSSSPHSAGEKEALIQDEAGSHLIHPDKIGIKDRFRFTNKPNHSIGKDAEQDKEQDTEQDKELDTEQDKEQDTEQDKELDTDHKRTHGHNEPNGAETEGGAEE